MKSIITLFTFTLLQIACSEKTHENPNFLVIIVDDLGYHDLSCMGSQYYETPNIDQIAKNGVIFTRGYSNSAVCSPSRASFLTGKYTAHHGITDYIGARTGTEWRKMQRFTKMLPATYVRHLPHAFTTFPEVLKEHGYTNFYAGKWHLGSAEEGSLPTDHGFDVNKGGYHVGGPYSGGYFSPFNNPYMEDYEEEKGMDLSMKLARETTALIEQNKDSTFLAILSFYAVHSPIQTSEERWKKYRDKAESMGIKEEGFDLERRLPIRKHQDNPVYAGLIEQMDDAVGHVLNTLKELNLDKKTVVIFVSDHGGVSSGDNYSTSNLPLRGGKGYQWEAGIRIPYFVKVPWLNQQGEMTDTPVTGADLYPTILELAGIDIQTDHGFDGQSIVPLMNGEELPQRPLYWHYPHYGNQGGDPNSTLMEGDWKLIHYWENNQDELYNIKTDIGEKNDLAADHPERVKTMKDQLMTWLDEAGAELPVLDPLYEKELSENKQEERKQTLLQELEKRRKEMLGKDWQPNDNWWKSKVTID